MDVSKYCLAVSAVLKFITCFPVLETSYSWKDTWWYVLFCNRKNSVRLVAAWGWGWGWALGRMGDMNADGYGISFRRDKTF